MAIKQVALSALALAAAGAAQAQSSVTLYGVADVFVQVAHGADTITSLNSGGLAGSRLGVRGTEDLGGGLRAVFTLESGVNLDDGTVGQGGRMWGRQAFVGLTSSSLGSLTFGRQYGSLFPLTSEYSAFANGIYGPSTAVIGGFGGYEPVRGSANSATDAHGPARINNSIKYETPSFAGLKGGALWGLGEAGTGKTRLLDVWARYSAGPLDAMLSVVDDRVANGLAARTVALAGSYSFGAARVLGGYLDYNDRSAANNDGKGFWIGGDYRFGPHLVRAQYVVNKPDGRDTDTQAFGVGYQYDLSKRTALYTSLTQFKNDNGARRWNSGSNVGSLLAGSERDITEFVVGVRHSF
jgi:predicted porin